MDVCRTIVVVILALALLQMSQRVSYDGGGWQLAAAPVATGRA